ncbi:hypothetical protein [Acidovorax sp. Leaf78]|uniref:hypothetical protein n=1 Tax=unclassified Acidovorax TaxID=2684926 RepID=UPI0012E0EB16|nr:hypothetical protein [Acidovorax sp. Leaf78]
MGATAKNQRANAASNSAIRRMMRPRSVEEEELSIGIDCNGCVPWVHPIARGMQAIKLEQSAAKPDSCCTQANAPAAAIATTERKHAGEWPACFVVLEMVVRRRFSLGWGRAADAVYDRAPLNLS